uniref:Uncharacterized protein n=1 Tax=Solanum lycopersicum TaxID=4081 RepID=A0A3Q7EFQ5_SOLLC
MVRCVEVFKEFYQTKGSTGDLHGYTLWVLATYMENLSQKIIELVFNTYQIFNKEQHTKIISLTDVLEFNSTFIDKMRRIKIPLPPIDEKKKVIEEVDKDMQYAIDASSCGGGGLGG